MVSKEVQQLIVQAQSFQQQLQMVENQKEAISMQLVESNKALEELSKPGEGEVYKVTGPVLVKVARNDAKKDVESRKELAMLRLKTIEKSESGLKGKLEELKGKLEKAGI
jgi:prefoldin beta subunit